MDVLGLVVGISEVTVFAYGFQRVLDECRLGDGAMTLLAWCFPQAHDMGLVRHDQVAFYSPGKPAGGVLSMAKQALLRGVAGMTALGEHIAVARQTLADVKLFEVVCPASVFLVARGACLIKHVMTLTQEDGAMTGNTPFGYRTSPGLMATAAAALEGGMRSGHLFVHEDRLMAREEHRRCEGHDQGHTPKDSIPSGKNSNPLSVIQHPAAPYGAQSLVPPEPAEAGRID